MSGDGAAAPPKDRLPEASLPPGQRARDDFPRFGLSQFARRFPKQAHRRSLEIDGDVGQELRLPDAFAGLSRVEVTADFHCVTTWTCRSLTWSGVRLIDFYEEVIVPRCAPAEGISTVVFRGQDGARSSLPLEDALRSDVLLADTLNGESLTVEHGAPIRVVAPAHYGYKSVKYLSRISFLRDPSDYRPVSFGFMDHPRARVAQEERGRWVPGSLLRWLYRPLVEPTVRRFAKALAAHERRG